MSNYTDSFLWKIGSLKLAFVIGFNQVGATKIFFVLWEFGNFELYFVYFISYRDFSPKHRLIISYARLLNVYSWIRWPTKISGLVWGLSFLQYCWEDELIFYYEKCQDDPGYKCFEHCKTNHSVSNSIDCIAAKCDPEPVMCNSAYKEFSRVFAIMSLTCSCSGIVFEPISRTFGMFAVRLTMCLFSITGHVCLIFYQTNPDMIYVGWTMMGFPTFIYLTCNIDEQAARWPEKDRALQTRTSFICKYRLCSKIGNILKSHELRVILLLQFWMVYTTVVRVCLSLSSDCILIRKKMKVYQ